MDRPSSHVRPVKYELGVVELGSDYVTVNLNDDADILNVDRYIKRDGRVDEIRLSRTLEHVPSEEYVDFILALRRKLKCGGRIVVIQTDAGSVIRQWTEGEISFRAMWSIFFPTGDRLQLNSLNAHFQMWDFEELAEGYRDVGILCGTFSPYFHPEATVFLSIKIDVEHQREFTT